MSSPAPPAPSGALFFVASQNKASAHGPSPAPRAGKNPLPYVEWVEADLAEPDALPSTFEGADRLFLLTGNAKAMTRLQKNAIDAAAEAGIDHVVKLSAPGAVPESKSAIGRFTPGTAPTHRLTEGRGAWVQVVDGTVSVNDVTLRTGDGAGLTAPGERTFSIDEETELLLVDVRMDAPRIWE